MIVSRIKTKGEKIVESHTTWNTKQSEAIRPQLKKAIEQAQSLISQAEQKLTATSIMGNNFLATYEMSDKGSAYDSLKRTLGSAQSQVDENDRPHNLQRLLDALATKNEALRMVIQQGIQY